MTSPHLSSIKAGGSVISSVRAVFEEKLKIQFEAHEVIQVYLEVEVDPLHTVG